MLENKNLEKIRMEIILAMAAGIDVGFQLMLHYFTKTELVYIGLNIPIVVGALVLLRASLKNMMQKGFLEKV